MDITSLHHAYASGKSNVSTTVAEIYARIAAEGLHPVWISLVPTDHALQRAAELEALDTADRAKLPLFGIPFAVKDNIDVANLPTTCGCPAFAFTPTESATVVTRLEAAGAILIGKTNMDQFATGLVGTRSPYGICSSVFNPAYISGGSSAGSAVAVASGLVTFALGTDTAGSGRVPAMFNNLIGLKPTRWRPQHQRRLPRLPYARLRLHLRRNLPRRLASPNRRSRLRRRRSLLPHPRNRRASHALVSRRHLPLRHPRRLRHSTSSPTPTTPPSFSPPSTS